MGPPSPAHIPPGTTHRGDGRSQLAVVLGVHTIVGAAVVLPWMRGPGRLLLLDWSVGPHPHVPDSFWALPQALSSGIGPNLVATAVAAAVGTATTSWLLIFLTFPMAGLGASLLTRGSTPSRLAAGLAYAVSPVVFDRLWAGQVAYLVAYALLPWAVRSAIESRRRGRDFRAALWIGALLVFSIHFAFIVAVVFIALLTSRRGVLRWAIQVALLTVLVSAHLFVSALSTGTSGPIGPLDLASFRTTGDPRLGLYLNVASLYGFWRREPMLAKQQLGGWGALMLCFLVVVIAGVWWGVRHRRADVTTLVVAGLAGYFLALGDQGPTGSIYAWLFDRLPGFAVMREPQKFIVLPALAYAVFFGWGVERLVETSRPRAGRSFVALALVLPIALDPFLFFGAAGRLESSVLPASWSHADRLMGDGSERILVLPWHQYLSFDFTGGRVVSNPATTTFRRPTIVGDDAELKGGGGASRSARSLYVKRTISQGPETTRYGHLIAPLGVKYIALLKAADWEGYAWLSRQTDLRPIMDEPEIVVFELDEPTGDGFSTGPVEQGTVEAVLGDPDRTATSAIAAEPTTSPRDGEVGAAAVDQVSAVEYRTNSRASSVVLPEPFDANWSGGRRVVEDVRGITIIVGPLSKGDPIRWSRWPIMRLAYALSITSTGAVAALCLADRARRRSSGGGPSRIEATSDTTTSDGTA